MGAKDDSEALEVRAVGKKLDGADPAERADPVVHYQAYARWFDHVDPEVVANTLLCLIHQTNYLLDRQIRALERDFVEGGGYSEQLAVARIAERKKQRETPREAAEKAPDCPLCGKPLALRTARQGANVGSQFWGCSGYPECRGTRKL